MERRTWLIVIVVMKMNHKYSLCYSLTFTFLHLWWAFSFSSLMTSDLLVTWLMWMSDYLNIKKKVSFLYYNLETFCHKARIYKGLWFTFDFLDSVPVLILCTICVGSLVICWLFDCNCCLCVYVFSCSLISRNDVHVVVGFSFLIEPSVKH